MADQLMTLKWHEFHESLAQALNVTVLLVTKDGDLVLIYNPLRPLSLINDYPVLRERYSEFFITIPESLEKKREVIMTDPFGLPLGVAALENGLFLIVFGGFSKDDSEARTRFVSNLVDTGINLDFVKNIADISSEELLSKLQNIKTLYGRLIHSCTETEELGQKMMLLAGVEEINKLMVSLLNPADFNLTKIMDLVASALIILFNAEGAWVLTEGDTCLQQTIFKGGCAKLLNELKAEWDLRADRSGDGIEKWVNEAKTRIASGYHLESIAVDRKQCAASLGIVSPGDGPAQMALEAFAKQIVIAMEVAGLYKVLGRRLGWLLSSLRHGVVIINHQGETMLVNKQARAILAKGGIALEPGRHISGQGLPHPLEQALLDSIQTGNTYFKEHEILLNGGEEVYISWDTAPARQDDGRVIGAILVIEDTSESVSLRRRVRDAERLTTAGEVASGLVHEMRNPLTTAGAAIQLMEMIDDETKRGELLKRLHQELKRMDKIMTDFLNFARPGKNLSLESLNVVRILEELDMLLHGEANLHDVELVISPPPDELPLVRGNRNGLKQVFLNITKNALEAMACGGRLEISLKKNENLLWVVFRDNGPGISPDNLENIMRPFFTTKVTGTGLGLSISAAIIERMGGRLSVESELGKGTTVYVGVPVDDEAE